MNRFEVLVVGGGIAGVSVGAELAVDRTVCLVEMEASLAFHTTGRSAATYLESYGGPIIRGLTVSSRSFFEDPPDGFDSPLLTPMPLLWLGGIGERQRIEDLEREVKPLVPSVQLVSPQEATEMCPILRGELLEMCMLEPGSMELDVSALHQGYVRSLRRLGGEIRTSSGVVALAAVDGGWRATTRDGEVYEAPVVVNAAGAWGDEVAAIAGIAPVGLQPLRRTLFTINARSAMRPADMPMIGDIGGTFYMKPEGTQFLCSPADETPSPPCDAKVDEIDVARALDRIRETTTLEARSVASSWAGLRTFTPDRSPLACYDPGADGFFWLVGQGGYGIQTAPSLARVAAGLIRGGGIPSDIAALGLEAAHMHRDRLLGSTGVTSH